jgi:trehalose 6-phosphate synthase
MPEYTSIREKLEATSGRINGRFAELDWVPIRYLSKALGRATLAGLYRASRLGLVTPYRDGMNLVAKEYVAAQNPQDPGCLVLSRFAGAATQLEGALIVNPYDTEEVAEAIQQGMQLSREERCTRWQTMMASVRRFDALWWRDAFVEALKTCRTGREEPAASAFALKPELAYPARGYGRSNKAKPSGAQSRHRAKPVLSLFGK